MSEKLYAWLLRLYPSRFREDYGEEALRLFRDRARDERGFFPRLRLWLDLFFRLHDFAAQRIFSRSCSAGRPVGSAALAWFSRAFCVGRRIAPSQRTGHRRLAIARRTHQLLGVVE